MKVNWVVLVLAPMFFLGCGPAPGNGSSQANSFPTKSITIICPWAPGGGTDRLTRFIADELQKAVGQPVIVVNKTGGSGSAGHTAGALAKPDGYTLTMATFELSTMHWMNISELTWESFTPVIQINADAAALIVRKNAAWNSMGSFLDHIKAHPGKVTMSGTATGGAWDLARAGWLLAAGLKPEAVLWVPTQGSAPSIVELLGGHIDSVCCSLPEASAQLEAGELKVLGVMAAQRLADFPEVKTVKEQGIDWEAVGWRGLALPKNTSPDIIEFYRERCVKIAESEHFKQFMKKNGFAISIRGPEEFAEFLRAQDAQWQTIVQAAGYGKK